jgi:hypothetical protein
MNEIKKGLVWVLRREDMGRYDRCGVYESLRGLYCDNWDIFGCDFATLKRRRAGYLSYRINGWIIERVHLGFDPLDFTVIEQKIREEMDAIAIREEKTRLRVEKRKATMALKKLEAGVKGE